ncbi:YdiU family protein [Lysinibacillus xylanilyticus]|uniref:protein adenylyltransferase SelO n=1 Tax=Lysinibacillus xylanilyticus TaxID=582475 RepID=UPI002B242183|nr:YdiU family protein [Lysinibacillus xylanilyticus]MEB2300835.1 YdiU family protein [Lysinibacillus xylanilyticus]
MENTMGWNFDNSYTRLPSIFYTSINLNPVRSPKLIMLNESVANSLGLNSNALKSEEAVAIFAGSNNPTGGMPIAQAYAGHQFGHFNMLGDGRALLLGEQITPAHERFDIALKGSGRTPYSRGGDGRAALGPMLREYIMSEAMYALGIPTTRSLAVVTTGEMILRETELPGAVLTRIASSHLRVGTFQYGANFGTDEELRALADYALARHFPNADKAQNRYLTLLQEVIKKQASLIAKWQLVGFIHGVMNTDNMAISGETIDYGPCAFMDTYDPATVFSSIDRQGRYAYGNQPNIGGWNLTRFAESLIPLIHENEEDAIHLAQEALKQYPQLYYANWLAGMRAKLGIFNEEDQDVALIEELLKLMQQYQADYTNTFIALTFDKFTESALFSTEEFKEWHKNWQARLERQQETKDASQQLMGEHNPAVIPRNHRVEEALEAAVEQEDYSVMERLLEALANPFAHSKEQQEYTTLPTPSNQPYRTFCGT